MVGRLIDGGPIALVSRSLIDAGGRPRIVLGNVDLVEREPIAHSIAELPEAYITVPREEVHETPIAPTPVLSHEAKWHLVMRKRNNRFYVVALKLGKYATVESEAALVGLDLVAFGEDAAPCDGEAQDLESHLGKERHVFLVAMIEIHAVVARVVAPCLNVGRYTSRRIDRAGGHHIGNRETLAVFLIGPLTLICRQSGSP